MKEKNVSTADNASDKENLKRILLGAKLTEDATLEPKIRPERLSEFLGQEKVKSNLHIFIESAKRRNECLDHIFLSSPAGLGKTTLARVIANEMGVEFKSITAPVLEKPKDLAGILSSLAPNSVLFIDEVHRLKKQLEEMLYIAMEDYRIDWILGAGTSCRTIQLPISKFTLIAATTKSGNISLPLYTRFGINLHMDLYPVGELSQIVKRTAKILNVSLTDSAVEKIALSSRGTPRVANRLVRRIRDFALVKGFDTIGEDVVLKAMETFDIDKYGLEKQDIKILDNLIRLFNGGPVGAETLAISIGESRETLEDFYEPYLIQCGFLQRTPRGRVATRKTYELFKIEGGKYANEGTLF